MNTKEEKKELERQIKASLVFGLINPWQAKELLKKLEGVRE